MPERSGGKNPIFSGGGRACNPIPHIPVKMPQATDNDDTTELLLTGDGRSRYVLHPVIYQDLYDMGVKAEEAIWTTGEIDLSRDIVDMAKLTKDQRHFILHVLAFFAGSDGIVIENLGLRFLREVVVPECRYFYGIQLGMETVHSKTYSLLISTYVESVEQQHELFRAIEEIPTIKAKADWAVRYIESDAGFAQRVFAFALVEGLFFSGSFAAIFYLKTLGLMPGLTFANELIARDEGMHCDFAILLYNKYLQRRLTDEQAHAMVRDAVAIESEFVGTALPVNMLGMNRALMTQYIEFVADRLLASAGHPKIYKATNPFPWMNQISVETKTNFFEGRVAEYKKSNVRQAEMVRQAVAVGGGKQAFAFTNDF